MVREGESREEASGRRAREIAWQLRHRLRSMSWWRGVMAMYPGGVVPLSLARDMLGVSKARVQRMIREGRLPTVGPMPGTRQRFIPADALLGAPTRLEAGRPTIMVDESGTGNWRWGRDGPLHNPWTDAASPPNG